MALEILWSGLLGLLAILAMGGLLALGAFYLPRFWRQGATGPEAGWGLGQMGPGLFAPAEPAPGPAPERPPVVLPPREPLAQRLAAPPEEPLLAAAISLALALYQQQQRAAPDTGPIPAPGSPWAWSGRWQAMQDRLQRQKR